MPRPITPTKPPWFDDITYPEMNPFKQIETGPLGDTARAATVLQEHWRVYGAEAARRDLAEAIYIYMSGHDNPALGAAEISDPTGMPKQDLRTLFLEAREARKDRGEQTP